MGTRIVWGLLLAVVVLGAAVGADGADNKKNPGKKRQGTIEGVVTDNTLGVGGPGQANVLCRITVSAAKDKGTLSITPQTRLVRKDGDNEVMAMPKDLTPGSTVRATYEQPVQQSRPWQSTALEVVIIKQAR